jgi:GT2 family glycosyltransferase
MWSVVCVTYNSEAHIGAFLRSVKEFSPEDTEIIVVDNSNKDYKLSFVKKNKEGSYPSGLNQGIALATGDNIVCCNPDIIVCENWLEKLLPKEDIVGPFSNFCSGIQGAYSSQMISVEVKFLIGFCFALSRSTYEKIGPFDEQFVYEQDDLDYSIRAREHNVKLIVKDCFIKHVGHGSADMSALNEKRFLSLYRILKKYPNMDFREFLGSGWHKSWLDKVKSLYPDAANLYSFRRAYV